MPTYEYQCEACGCKFERFMNMSDEPLKECPQCGGSVRRLIGSGAGFILKKSDSHHEGHHHRGHEGPCSLESSGRTCCGRDERCGNSTCGNEG
ncbi:MAG: zinc ribbon domain-containing protein [bacterium]